MLLNAAKCQGYSFYRFWVMKRKPTGGGGGKIPPPPPPHTHTHRLGLIQKFYLNLFLQKQAGHIYLNIRSFDKVAKDSWNEFSKSIFWPGVEEFLFK